jgi:hypothetical protein
LHNFTYNGDTVTQYFIRVMLNPSGLWENLVEFTIGVSDYLALSVY